MLDFARELRLLVSARAENRCDIRRARLPRKLVAVVFLQAIRSFEQREDFANLALADPIISSAKIKQQRKHFLLRANPYRHGIRFQTADFTAIAGNSATTV